VLNVKVLVKYLETVAFFVEYVLNKMF